MKNQNYEPYEPYGRGSARNSAQPMQHAGELSAVSYNVILGAVLLWGFAVNAYICTFYPTLAERIPIGALLIGYVICCIAGIMMVHRSSNPVISFIGYNLIVVPIGLVVSLFVNEYDPLLVRNAFLTTTMVTVFLLVMATVFHRFFIGMGRICFFSLLAALLAQVVLMLFHVNLGVLDWVIALIFCGYIGFDWARAQQKPYTIDTAVDSACDLYLDIINLFIRILSIMGRNRD